MKFISFSTSTYHGLSQKRFLVNIFQFYHHDLPWSENSRSWNIINWDSRNFWVLVSFWGIFQLQVALKNFLCVVWWCPRYLKGCPRWRLSSAHRIMFIRHIEKIFFKIILQPLFFGGGVASPLGFSIGLIIETRLDPNPNPKKTRNFL